MRAPQKSDAIGAAEGLYGGLGCRARCEISNLNPSSLSHAIPQNPVLIVKVPVSLSIEGLIF